MIKTVNIQKKASNTAVQSKEKIVNRYYRPSAMSGSAACHPVRREVSESGQRKKIRYRRIWKIRIISAVILILCGCLFYSSILTSAHNSTAAESYSEAPLYFKSIVIQPGDTLWDIAEEYMSSEYSTVTEYIEELIELNQLDSESIKAGDYLLISYEADTTESTSAERDTDQIETVRLE